MIVLKYDLEKYSPQEINDTYIRLKQCLKDTDVIAIPNDWEVLLDCSTNELYHYIDEIKNIIRKKELINEN